MRKEGILLFLLSILSSIELYFYFSPNNQHWLAWSAFLPVWFAAIKAKNGKEAFTISFFSFYILYFFALDWMRDIFSWKTWIFYAIFSFWPTIHSLALRKIWTKAKSFSSTSIWISGFLVSALYTGLEYFRCEVWFLNCPWLALGYGQSSNHALYQGIDILGVFSITFFIIFFNFSILALICARKISPLIFSVFLMLILTFYGENKIKKPFGKESIKSMLVQDESYSFERLFNMSKIIKDEDIIIWPENSFFLKEGESIFQYLDKISETFKNKKIGILVPVGIKKEKDGRIKRENFAIFMDTKYSKKQIYKKMHPVPFIESGLDRGPEPEPIEYHSKKLGVQICYDLNFENGSRILARKGAQIILAPTNDPIEWTAKQQRQHADMSSARAIENGLWILRPATSGISQVIDKYGFTHAEIPSATSATLTASAFLENGQTFYNRYGWLFPKTCLFLSLFILIYAFYPLNSRK